MKKHRWLAVVLAVAMLLGMVAVVQAEDHYPAAPAIAVELLREAGVQQVGPYVARVARETKGKDATFLGQFDKYDPLYRDAVRDFLSGLGIVFSPSNYSGLVLWLDATEFANETDNALVSQWTDLSGQDNHAIQINSAAMPKVALDELNGLPTVRFDGSNDYFAANTVAASLSGEDKPYSAFVVMRRNVDDRQDAIYSFGLSTTWVPVINARTTSAATDASSDQLRVIRRDDARLLKQALGGPIGSDPAVVSIVDSGTMLSAYKDSAKIISDVDLDVGPITVDQFSIGATRIGTSFYHFFYGDIAEILIFNRALSDSERAAVEHYLKTKYGL